MRAGSEAVRTREWDVLCIALYCIVLYEGGSNTVGLVLPIYSFDVGLRVVRVRRCSVLLVWVVKVSAGHELQRCSHQHRKQSSTRGNSQITGIQMEVGVDDFNMFYVGFLLIIYPHIIPSGSTSSSREHKTPVVVIAVPSPSQPDS